MTKPNTEAEREQRRAAIREQILRDQSTNAKRNAEALEREASWHRANKGKR